MPTTPGHGYGGVPAEERERLRRDRLIDASLDVMHDGSWRSATVAALCAAAGLNKRYFYESFTDLDDLARQAVEHVASLVAAAALEAFPETSPEEPLESRARRVLDAAVGMLVDDPRHAQALFGPVAAGPDLLEHRSTVVIGLTDVLVEYAREIHDVELEADSLAVVAPAFLVGGTGEAVLAWLRHPGRSDRDRLVDDLLTLWLLVGNGSADVARDRLQREGGSAVVG